MGMDMYFHEYLEPPLIYLEMSSVLLSEPENFFVTEQYSPDISINCESSYFSLINADLYVAPWGDDNNSGLNENEPLQTIAYAMQIIEPDSLNPKTIHLAEGTYSYSQNGQIFPFAVKSHIRLQGAGMENTIFDAEYYSAILVIMKQSNVQVSDINIIDCRSTSITGVTACQYSEDIVFKNILIENSLCSSTSGLSFSRNTGIIVENVIVRDASNNEQSTIGIYDYSNEITINKMTIRTAPHK